LKKLLFVASFSPHASDLEQEPHTDLLKLDLLDPQLLASHHPNRGRPAVRTPEFEVFHPELLPAVLADRLDREYVNFQFRPFCGGVLGRKRKTELKLVCDDRPQLARLDSDRGDLASPIVPCRAKGDIDNALGNSELVQSVDLLDSAQKRTLNPKSEVAGSLSGAISSLIDLSNVTAGYAFRLFFSVNREISLPKRTAVNRRGTAHISVNKNLFRRIHFLL
jgi:hypothetical protein